MSTIWNNKRLQKIYAICIIILLIGVLALQREQIFGYRIFQERNAIPEPSSFDLSDVKAIFKKADQFKIENDSIFVYTNHQQIGWAFNSSPVSDSIIGFTSSVPVLMGFDLQDKVQGIHLLKNYESPDFIDKIVRTGFFQKWDRMPIADILNSKVDVVSGATLSSRAIIKTIRHSTAKFLKQQVRLNTGIDFLSVAKNIMGILLLILALVQFFYPKVLKPVRIYYQILLVAVLGFWMGTFLSIFSLNNWLSYGIDLPTKLFAFSVLVLSVMLPISKSKSFYCVHLCPFGASQDLLGKLRRNKLKFSPQVSHFLFTLREKIFACIILLMYTGVAMDLTKLEPFSAFLFRSASVPVLILAIVFLTLSVLTPRPWCNYACPTGYLLETIRKPFKN